MSGFDHPQRLPLVAIDGPSGAGKSTVGKALAQRLSFRYIDTGAIYRSLAYVAQQQGVSWDDEANLATLVGSLPIQFHWQDGQNRVLLAGEDCTAGIRSEAMGLGASRVSRWPMVRAGLLDLQRLLGERGGVIMDGRDIGTVVFPDAEVKFFLSASLEERARRRHEELVSQGQEQSLEKVMADLEVRDRQDSQRAVAPLKCADDAIRVDSTGRTIDQVVEWMAHQVSLRMQHA